ncbi:MAG: hypothetical protein A2X49_12290 [Lentisphaerae bacterium GWF2_52_8]|nr:MAG: hypothetical protein A2X49_12290 [Lentisphaerae bacterium GWF2_52_8]
MASYDWHYDEFVQKGTDYGDLKNVEEYDARHSRFRDYEKEAEEKLSKLKADSESVIIDLGCGTGAFALIAAMHCRKIHAVDVSEAMLEYASRKARKAGLGKIEFHKGGFLSYEHKGEPADALVSSAVLHHLPDFWKQIALKRIYSLIKPGGRFFLFDVVFSFNPDDCEKVFDDWLKGIEETLGPEFAREAAVHLRDEYSTFSWVMEGLLARAGFEIESCEYEKGLLAKYLCRKPVL